MSNEDSGAGLPEIDLRDTHPLQHPLVPCPHCGEERLEPVRDRDTVNFLCGACGRCWHVELGWVHRVDPRSCDGCPSPAACAALFAADHVSR